MINESYKISNNDFKNYKFNTLNNFHKRSISFFTNKNKNLLNFEEQFKKNMSHIPSEKELKKKRNEYFKNRRARLILEKLGYQNNKNEKNHNQNSNNFNSKTINLVKGNNNNIKQYFLKNENSSKNINKKQLNLNNEDINQKKSRNVNLDKINLSPIQKRKSNLKSSNTRSSEERHIFFDNSLEMELNIKKNKNINNNTNKNNIKIIDDTNLENENNINNQYLNDNKQTNIKNNINNKKEYEILIQNNLNKKFQKKRNNLFNRKKNNSIDDEKEEDIEINKLIKLLKFKNHQLLMPLQELQKNNKTKLTKEEEENIIKRNKKNQKIKDIYFILGNINKKNNNDNNEKMINSNYIKNILRQTHLSPENHYNKNQFRLMNNYFKYKEKKYKSIFKKEINSENEFKLRNNFLNENLSPRTFSIKDNESYRSSNTNINLSERLLSPLIKENNLAIFPSKQSNMIKNKPLNLDYLNHSEKNLFRTHKNKYINYSYGNYRTELRNYDLKKNNLTERENRHVFIMPINPMNDIIEARMNYF